MTDFKETMRKSLALTRAGNPASATRLIQESLLRSSPDAKPASSRPAIGSATDHARRRNTRSADADVEDAEILDETPSVRATRSPPASRAPGSQGRSTSAADAAAAPTRLERRRHDCAYGMRDYLLFVPSGDITGIIVMLHGCTQTAEDFSRGTGMNEAAGPAGFIVIWPEQGRAYNGSLCWNWFRGSDQAASGGEPALLADLVRTIAREHGVAEGRSFAAGLSAGGAMAAILGQTHPELFAAIGVHSGLAPCSAHDAVSAFGAMRGDPAPSARPLGRPCIVFQGLADHTVAPVNAHRLTGPLIEVETRDHTGPGRTYRTTRGQSGVGQAVELWEIEGAGHAWAGGKAGSSYTDPSGPNASIEMVRFFSTQVT
ncbi:extracellular catalytic domain type 1 short-chain-length polyhydroxyalkanoate depolymerase [Wenxinia saemankumensis]|uniref:Esterase, PHB depolymerase family n=1 Tax=Wenxinia saemankumensis TaxID=1447782 RepID=A0A1M6B671_9RHOB|nr:PHB depolymerase family esterase [Wenxinia saemankumensis]SHI44205.1 esterase, PHB depolymerase family [Wenxinia saemankumensis]